MCVYIYIYMYISCPLQARAYESIALQIVFGAIMGMGGSAD